MKLMIQLNYDSIKKEESNYQGWIVNDLELDHLVKKENSTQLNKNQYLLSYTTKWTYYYHNGWENNNYKHPFYNTEAYFQYFENSSENESKYGF